MSEHRKRARTLTRITNLVTQGSPPPDAAEAFVSALSLPQLSAAVWASVMPPGLAAPNPRSPDAEAAAPPAPRTAGESPDA